MREIADLLISGSNPDISFLFVYTKRNIFVNYGVHKGEKFMYQRGQRGALTGPEIITG